MKVAIVDGLGGGLGARIVTILTAKAVPDLEIIALGTNSIATSKMLKSGAKIGATGENAIVVSIAKADIVVGPIGIIVANALMGEITPKIACAVADSPARKILMPINHCHFEIAGVAIKPLSSFIDDAVELTLKEE